jgi:WD40 repeat protein
VKVFDVADGKELGKFESQAKRMECLAFSPDGTRLATHSKDDDAAMGVEIWDLASGREVFRLKLPDHWEEWPVTFSPDLRQVAAGWGRTVRLWDATGHPEAILCRGGANSLAFAPDDRRLALAGGTVRICDASAGQELRKFGQETTGAVFGPGGEWLAAARGTEVIFWNLSSGQELLTVKGPADPRGEAMPRPGISSLAVSPDGRWLAVGTSRDTPGGPGQIEVCRIPDLRPSPDKPSPASSSADPVLLLKGHKYRVTSLAFSPDGTQLASASDDGAMKLWDVPSLVALAADQQKAGLAPDQIEAALAQRACTLTGHSSVAYSPDGKLLATAGPNATVRLCDPATGREVRVFRGHTRAVNCVAFSPDGKQLVSGSGDWSEPGELKLWDVACGQELLSLVAPDGVQCVAFSHCGRRLAVNAPVGRSFSHPHPADSSKWAWNITLIPAGRPLCQPDLTVASVHILDARPLTDETRLQREAVSLYRHAAQTQLLQDEVADQIRQDRSVTAAVRQQALAWTQHFQGNRNRLNEASRAIVQPADADAAEYRRALRYAVAADRLMPDTIEHLNTLGMAQYRVGQYQEALVALTRARDLILAKDKSERAPHASQPPPPDEDPEARTIPLGTTFLILVENPAFLAMTQHRLGQKEQSRATLHELHKIIRALKKSDWDAYEGRWGAFLREAETLVEGDAEPKESEPKKPKSETRPKDE